MTGLDTRTLATPAPRPVSRRDVRYDEDIAVFTHDVALIIVNRMAAQLPLHEAIRYAWRVNIARIKAVDFLLPVVDGIIRGAYTP